MLAKENSLMENEGKVKGWIIAISVIIPVVVAVLIFMPSKIDLGAEWVYFLPHLNAVINSAATLALIAGLLFIKKGNIPLHRASMTTAFSLGAIFLVSYVVYHAAADSTSFGGEGMIRSIYYFLLLTHIILAAVALFPILFAYYYGYTDQREKHRKVVKFAYPIWLYVTVTGVIVYLMISPYYVH
ncbi:putative membrane protein [Algoriphagus sp. 4150]|nr:putative membrane protein [Algoriphagus sp. 4150]